MNGAALAMRRLALVAGILATMSACEASKSRNPLSPSVAGPIPGVAISAPEPVSPANGTVVRTTERLRLVFRNASSNGERPFWYNVEMSLDPGFGSKVYSGEKIQPSGGSETSVDVSIQLQGDRTYHWRVKADDGANSSAYSSTASFDAAGPVSIAAPIPYSPIGSETTTSTTPELLVTNTPVSGRPARVEYRFEVATDAGFGNVVARMSAERSGGVRTSVTSSPLPANALLFWRALGTDGQVSSAWSVVERFRTPASGGGGGGGGGGGYVPPVSPAPGGRTPDPPAGGKLPLPNMSSVVMQIASAYPNALRNSCQDQGGTWEFMDRVVDELRKYDSRWGYNGKRGNVADPSKDAVDYHWGRGADEGSTEVYIIDIIGGHCGANPSPGWSDVTDVTINSGTIGRWTGRGRF